MNRWQWYVNICLFLTFAGGLAPHASSQSVKPAATGADSVDDQPTAETEAKIKRLIEDLGHSKYREREVAEREIRKFGLVAIEPLREASDHEDIEIRLRVRSLAAELRSRLIQEGIPPIFRPILQDYEKQTEQRRLELILQVKSRPENSKVAALATLARFEESELLAKEAALGVLQSDLSQNDELPETRRSLRAAIGLNRRPAIEWIRSYLDSYDDIDESLASFGDWIEAERVAFRTTNGKTDSDVIERLVQFRIDLLLRGGYREQAMTEMRSLHIGDLPMSAWLLVEWLMERSAWDVVEELAQKHRERFDKDALLLYRVAEASLLAGRTEAAKQVAEQAFQAEGSGIGQYKRWLSTPWVLELAPQMGDVTEVGQSHRYMIARVLEDDRGLFEWAEREYRAALPEKLNGQLAKQIHTSFAEMLHDQLKDKEAGDVIKLVVDQIATDEELKKQEDDAASFISTMHYYYGLDAGRRNDTAAQMEHLSQALIIEKPNPDILIAMYRVENPTEEFRVMTAKAIQTVTDELFEAITTYREQSKVVGRDVTRSSNLQLAGLENEYAWLVGNTTGDIEEAIRCSHHSLEINTGNPGGLLDTLARCYYRKGDLKKAVEYQQQAASLLPHEGQITRQLKLFEDALAESQTADEDRTADKKSAPTVPATNVPAPRDASADQEPLEVTDQKRPAGDGPESP